jgi:hypothetical protein
MRSIPGGLQNLPILELLQSQETLQPGEKNKKATERKRTVAETAGRLTANGQQAHFEKDGKHDDGWQRQS